MFALQNYQNEKKEGVFTANKMWTIFSMGLLKDSSGILGCFLNLKKGSLIE